jgi:hypothetical protein
LSTNICLGRIARPLRYTLGRFIFHNRVYRIEFLRVFGELRKDLFENC